MEKVLDTKEKKRLLLTGAARFNKGPKTGIAFLKEHGFINDTPESLAMFLKNTPRLDKRLLGDFISKPSNTDILNAFMTLFDFKEVRDFAWSRPRRFTMLQKPVAESMREMLESFRLPGESQQIERITGVFAEKYYIANTDCERGFASLQPLSDTENCSGNQILRRGPCPLLLYHHVEHGPAQPEPESTFVFRVTVDFRHLYSHRNG